MKWRKSEVGIDWSYDLTFWDRIKLLFGAQLYIVHHNPPPRDRNKTHRAWQAPPNLTYQERMVVERDELNIKILKLDNFLVKKHNIFSTTEADLMFHQLDVMYQYLAILTERIRSD